MEKRVNQRYLKSSGRSSCISWSISGTKVCTVTDSCELRTQAFRESIWLNLNEQCWHTDCITRISCNMTSLSSFRWKKKLTVDVTFWTKSHVQRLKLLTILGNELLWERYSPLDEYSGRGACITLAIMFEINYVILFFCPCSRFVW